MGPALLVGLATLLLVPAPTPAQPPVMTGPRVLDGPSPDITALSGIAIARDGGGGLVYLKNVGGIAHVFVSRLVAGVFQAPVEVDAAFPGPSSEPVIAAANGGQLTVAFINAGSLYETTATSALSALPAPAALFAGAIHPAIASSTLGKIYLAFTATAGAGNNVRCAYYNNGQWGIEADSLNASPQDDAGTGSGRPAVAVANDGVGIVAWGEGGHVYVRRVWATQPSIVFEQADVPSVGGWNEVSASLPAVGSGAGDSSYFSVAFREILTGGASQQSRVFDRRLIASQFQGLTAADGLSTPGPEGASGPVVAVGEYGEGFVTSARDVSNQVTALRLAGSGSAGTVSRLDSLTNIASPFPAAASAGYHSIVVAWQQTPGTAGPADIHARYFDGSAWQSEQVLSAPANGPANAADGLVVDGDIAADVAAAWVQGSGANTQIVVGQGYQPPGSFGLSATFAYARTTQPVLSWTQSRANWGPLVYTVTLDGNQLAQTAGTSLTVPAAPDGVPLTQGRHSYFVTVTNPAGQSRSTGVGTVFVDTLPPSVSVTISGRRRVGSRIRVRIHETDAPPASIGGQGSGIASSLIQFGDRTSAHVRRQKVHVYQRARRYRIIVTVTDRAGNRTRVILRIKIARAKNGRHHG